jgi:hypothetical protein
MAEVSGKAPRATSSPAAAVDPPAKPEVTDKPKRAVTEEGEDVPLDDDEADATTDREDGDDPPTRPITPARGFSLPSPSASTSTSAAPSAVLRGPAEPGLASPKLQVPPEGPAEKPADKPAAPRQPRAQTPVPVVGSSLLARSAPSKLPWLLVVMLVVAVIGLVAYIVMT